MFFRFAPALLLPPPPEVEWNAVHIHERRAKNENEMWGKTVLWLVVLSKTNKLVSDILGLSVILNADRKQLSLRKGESDCYHLKVLPGKK